MNDVTLDKIRRRMDRADCCCLDHIDPTCPYHKDGKIVGLMMKKPVKYAPSRGQPWGGWNYYKSTTLKTVEGGQNPAPLQEE